LPSHKHHEVTHNPVGAFDSTLNFALKVAVVAGDYCLGVASGAMDGSEVDVMGRVALRFLVTLLTSNIHRSGLKPR
jgi:hypothetical protein